MKAYYFTDLVNIKTFINLKQEFLLKEALDYLQKNHTRDDIDQNLILVENRSKIMEEFNVSNADIDNTESNFNKFYIIPKLSSIAQNHIDAFFDEIKEKAIFTKEGLDNFKELTISQLNSLIDKIEGSKHLDNLLIDKARNQILHIIDTISAHKHSELTKMPMKLSRVEVITFFHLLKINGYIAPRFTKNDVSHFIENNFQYYDKDDDLYKEIKRAGVTEHENIGEKRVRKPDSALQKLREIFTDEFFKIQ